MENEVIEVRNISKNFQSVKALDDVSFGIEKNTIFGLLGSNGAGKSTLLHIITGLLTQSSGEIFIFGEKIKKYSNRLKRKVAIVPQKISLYEDLSILDNLYFFAKAYGFKNKEIIEKITSLNNILKLGDLKRKIKHLSGGYQRKVSLAVSLIGDPEIIILDEALVGIDLETKNIIISLLIKLKETKTIIITTHSVKEAEELCDYVCFLHKGKKVLYGKTKDIIKKYSKEGYKKLIITFKDDASALRVSKYFKGGDDEIKLINNILTIKFYLENFSLIELLDVIQEEEKDRKAIQDIEVESPGLEYIILKLIKSDI